MQGIYRQAVFCKIREVILNHALDFVNSNANATTSPNLPNDVYLRTNNYALVTKVTNCDLKKINEAER